MSCNTLQKAASCPHFKKHKSKQMLLHLPIFIGARNRDRERGGRHLYKEALLDYNVL